MYSTTVYFTINNGRKRNQTVVGGLLTILSGILMIVLCSFFLVDFFNGKSSLVLSQDETTEDITIPLHNYPFMLRLSTDKAEQYPEQERLYTISLQLKIGGGIHSTQWNDDIPMEQCNINKHFGKYASMFENMKDLNTFFCPITRTNNQSIVGLYGGEKLFQYYHFYITMCVNKTSNSNCYSKTYINNQLQSTFLDVRTIDYNLNLQNKNGDPFNMYIRTDRHSLSNTVYKRIWMYMENIDYYKDIGLFFNSNKHVSFFKVNSFHNDIEIRNAYANVERPGTFASLSILNYMNKRTYYARYIKIHEFFADIGGITKLIIVCCSCINYIFSEVAYKKKIMKYTLEEYNQNYNHKYKDNSTDTHQRSTSILNTLLHTKVFTNQNDNAVYNNNNNNTNINGQSNENMFSKIHSNNVVNQSKNSLVSIQHNNKIAKTKLFSFEVSAKTQKGFLKSTQLYCKKFCNCELLVTKLLCSPRKRNLYYDNYFIINTGLDIVHYFYLKRKVYELSILCKKNITANSDKQLLLDCRNQTFHKQHHTMLCQNKSTFFVKRNFDFNNNDNNTDINKNNSSSIEFKQKLNGRSYDDIT